MAHITGGTVAVVGKGLHDDGNALGAIAFVGDGFVILTGAAGSIFLQHPIDVVIGHIVGLGLGDYIPQLTVDAGVGRAAGADDHRHLTGEFGEYFGALLIHNAFFSGNIMPFGMSGHFVPSYILQIDSIFSCPLPKKSGQTLFFILTHFPVKNQCIKPGETVHNRSTGNEVSA